MPSSKMATTRKTITSKTLINSIWISNHNMFAHVWDCSVEFCLYNLAYCMLPILVHVYLTCEYICYLAAIANRKNMEFIIISPWCELWGVYREGCGEHWPCYNGTVLYQVPLWWLKATHERWWCFYMLPWPYLINVITISVLYQAPLWWLRATLEWRRCVNGRILLMSLVNMHGMASLTRSSVRSPLANHCILLAFLYWVTVTSQLEAMLENGHSLTAI